MPLTAKRALCVQSMSHESGTDLRLARPESEPITRPIRRRMSRPDSSSTADGTGPKMWRRNFSESLVDLLRVVASFDLSPLVTTHKENVMSIIPVQPVAAARESELASDPTPAETRRFKLFSRRTFGRKLPPSRRTFGRQLPPSRRTFGRKSP
jgi:hypothetical protein